MEKRENKHQEVSAGMKVCRVVGVVLVLAAIAYVIWGPSRLRTAVSRSQSVATFVGNSTCFPHFLHC